MTHEQMIARWLRGVGVEIGAFKYPVPGIKPFYVDRFREYAGERCLADYWGDACNLPFRDDSLDYVVSSHVLEHVANPVAALKEWVRVLRHGGIIYLLVPDRRHTWDRARELTPPRHMLADFEQGITQADGTHIADFVDNVDWSTYSPATPPAEVPEKKRQLKETYFAAVKAGAEINIHFHVFEPSNLLTLIELLESYPGTRFRWKIVNQAERFPDNNPIGFLVVIRVAKPLRARLKGWLNRWQTACNPRHPVLPGARPFASERIGHDPPARS